MTFLHRILFFCLILVSLIGVGALEARANPQDDKPQIAKNTIAGSENLTPPETENAPKSDEKTEDPSSNNYKINYNQVGVQTDVAMPITLNEAIRKALQNNNDIEISKTDVRIAETTLRSLLGIFDPVFTVSPTYTRSQSTGSTPRNDFRVNANVTQNAPTGGGFYQVFFNNNRTESSFAQSQLSSGTSSSSSALYFSSLGFQFTQPLLRNFRIDNTRRGIKIQRKRLQQSDADFRRQTIETISQVQRGYWDLVFALRDLENRKANLDLAKENLRQVVAKIDAGALAPLARAEVNIEVANRESDLLLAAQNVSTANNTLKTLLLRDATSSEWGASYVPTDQPVYSEEPVVLGEAVKDAMDNRPELRRLKLEKEINDIDLRYFRNQLKPQLDLVSTFSLNGLASGTGTVDSFVRQFTGNDEILRQNLNTLLAPERQIPNPLIFVPGTSAFQVGGFNRSLSNIFRSDAVNFSVGVTFSFPLGNKTAKADLAGAQIQQERIGAQTRSQEQTVLAEVRNAVQALETARQRVLAARRARENAQIQLDGERTLFDSGRSTTFILFQRENALANAKNAEIRAETDFNKAIADLQRATSTTFQMNNIEIESPLDDQ
jgi:HAE1 family hydrophobic/amphiphilic exporter-1